MRFIGLQSHFKNRYYYNAHITLKIYINHVLAFSLFLMLGPAPSQQEATTKKDSLVSTG